MYKMMHCYDKHSKLLALIENDAISEMTWHKDGLYIYARRKYDEYGVISLDRYLCIICEWTKMEEMDFCNIDYLQNHGTPVYFHCDDICEETYNGQIIIR